MLLLLSDIDVRNLEDKIEKSGSNRVGQILAIAALRSMVAVP